MPDYRVRWEIDVIAQDVPDAIREARAYMAIPDVHYTFDVWEHPFDPEDVPIVYDEEEDT